MIMTKGLLYYTDNQCDEKILRVVQENLKEVCNNYKIVSVSLKPINFGENIVMNLERGYITMFRQILTGLETIDADVVFFAEHDVLYPACHFDFVPPRDDVYYYNENWWMVRASDGKAVTWKALRVGGLCAYRSLLLQHYRERIRRIDAKGRFFRRMGFEPGLTKYARGVDNYPTETWRSEHPYIDIRHDNNITWNRFEAHRFIGGAPEGWAESGEIPFWGKTKGRFNDFLNDILERR
jgi:hypothetical protein